MSRLVYSADAWRLFHGVVSVYKPAGMRQAMLYKVLKHAVVSDLNQMERRVQPGLLEGGLLERDPRTRLLMIPQSSLLDNKMQISQSECLMPYSSEAAPRLEA